eukprot:461434-Pelagomonas_calceolata.AAC.9
MGAGGRKLVVRERAPAANLSTAVHNCRYFAVVALGSLTAVSKEGSSCSYPRQHHQHLLTKNNPPGEMWTARANKGQEGNEEARDKGQTRAARDARTKKGQQGTEKKSMAEKV